MKKPTYEFNDFIAKIFDIKEKSAKTITFQVTEDCCLHCTYCYQINKAKNKMTFDTAKTFIDYLFEHRLDDSFDFSEVNAPGLIIEFIGGEPLLEVHLIHQIIDYFEFKLLEVPESSWNLFHIYSFSTNGVLYFNEEFQKLIEEYGSIFSVGVTIDGNKELHDSCRVFEDGSGSYDKAIQAALHFAETAHSFNTKITISPENVKYVAVGLMDLISKGFSEVNINCAYEEGWELKHAQELYKQLKEVSNWLYEENLYDYVYIALLDSSKYENKSLDKNWCGCSDSMMALDYEGKIYPCIRFMKSSLGETVEPYQIGNVNDGFYTNEIEKNRKIEMDKLSRGAAITNVKEECLTCPIRSCCSWCSAYNYQYYGDISKRTTFICQMHKAAALGSLYCALINKDYNSYSENGITKEIALEIITEEEWEKLQWKEE